MTLGTLSAVQAAPVNADPILVAAPGPTVPGGVPPEMTQPLASTTCPSGQSWDPSFQTCIDPNVDYSAIFSPPASWIPGVSNNTVLLGGAAVLVLFMMGRRR
jgi:hypothetical protein